MSIKSRRYRKRSNKSRGTRKNKTIRRYKKQMKGGVGLNREEYEKRQREIQSRIDEIFSGRKFLVAKYDDRDKLIIEMSATGDIYSFNYEPYVNSEGKSKVVRYDFTKQSFLNRIDEGKLKILDETVPI
jgi:hypothetical protein